MAQLIFIVNFLKALSVDKIKYGGQSIEQIEAIELKDRAQESIQKLQVSLILLELFFAHDQSGISHIIPVLSLFTVSL